MVTILPLVPVVSCRYELIGYRFKWASLVDGSSYTEEVLQVNVEDKTRLSRLRKESYIVLQEVVC